MEYLHSREMQRDLRDFFSRPVLIGTIPWVNATTLTTTNFITSWLGSSAIKRKLSDYVLARFDIHLRFVCQGNPLFRGAFRIVAIPNGGGSELNVSTSKTTPTYNFFPNNYISLPAET